MAFSISAERGGGHRCAIAVAITVTGTSAPAVTRILPVGAKRTLARPRRTQVVNYSPIVLAGGEFSPSVTPFMV